ncbi:uncharacterized protein Bfra_006530, partial [Botrytis fragariae]
YSVAFVQSKHKFHSHFEPEALEHLQNCYTTKEWLTSGTVMDLLYILSPVANHNILEIPPALRQDLRFWLPMEVFENPELTSLRDLSVARKTSSLLRISPTSIVLYIVSAL